MSGVVSPPPRPPRPFLPPTQQSKAAGTKPAPKTDGRAKNRPTSGTVIRTSIKPETLHRSSTYSSGSRTRLVRSQSPDAQQSPSSSEEVFLLENTSSTSNGTSQTQERVRVGSPPPRSLSISSKDDLEKRRWSYGFENKNKSLRYQPRAPPPRPPLRHTSSPEPENNSQEDIQIKRRSYTFGSAKSLPSFPVQRTRAISTDREPSISPKRGMSPSHSSSVEVMGTLVEKSRSASSSLENGAPLRPSRPPPPRTKSLPRAASLTTYKDRGLQRRPHSVSSTESSSVARPVTPQQDPPTSPAKPLPLEVNDIEQEHVQENVKGDKEQHDDAPASEEVPVIPPRPFRPPRPFPPGGTVKQKREKRTQKKRSQVQSAGSMRNEPHSEKGLESSRRPPVQPIELSPEPVNNAAPVAPDVDLPVKKEAFLSDQEFSDPSLDTKVSTSESIAPQETINAVSNEEPPAQPSSSDTGISETKQPEVVAKPLKLSEEEDQLSPLPQVDSPRSRGTRFIKSMKKSFRSLRSPNRKRKQDASKYGRPSSTSDVPSNDDASSGIYPDPLPQGIIHPIIVKCVAYLNKESVLKEEGLFRIPGDVAVIKKLRERFIAGSDVDLTEVADPHTVAGLLKLHFREQRISMIPRGQPLTTITQAVKDKDVESVRGVIHSIDVSHIAMLRLVAELLTMVSSFTDNNKMTSGTLATSCAPSMFPYLPTGSAVILMKFLIDHCSEVFQE